MLSKSQKSKVISHKLKGSIVIWLVLILVVIVGVFIFLGKLNLTSLKNSLPIAPPQIGADKQVNELGNLSQSDEIDAVESDLDSTKLDDLDKDLSEVDQALKE